MIVIGIVFLFRSFACADGSGVIDGLEGVLGVVILPTIHHGTYGLFAVTDELTGTVINYPESVVAGFAVTVIPIEGRDTAVTHGLTYIPEVIEAERLIGRIRTAYGTKLTEINRNTAAYVHIKQAI